MAFRRSAVRSRLAPPPHHRGRAAGAAAPPLLFVLRFLLAMALFVIGLAVGGGWGTFLAVFAFVPFLTGLVGWCPLYSVFHIRTNRERSEGSAVR